MATVLFADEKLNAVEKTYASRLENGSVLLEERFLSYQRNLDKQKQDELAVQVQPSFGIWSVYCQE